MSEASPNGGGRILVVDDEPSIVDAVATALRYEGFEVREEGAGDRLVLCLHGFPDEVAGIQSMHLRMGKILEIGLTGA